MPKRAPTDRHSERPSAVALSYELGRDPAPRVVASGRGLIAERIVDVARAHGVPVHRDPTVARLLQEVDVDGVIPQELYLAVAHILTVLYRAELEVRLANSRA